MTEFKDEQHTVDQENLAAVVEQTKAYSLLLNDNRFGSLRDGNFIRTSLWCQTEMKRMVSLHVDL